MVIKEVLEHQVFKGIEPNEVSSLLDKAETLEIEPLKKIFSEGDAGDGLYFVAEGRVNITKKNPDTNKDRLIVVLDKGDLFGELSIIDPAPRSASARTIEHAKLIKITLEIFETVWKNNENYTKLIKNISKMLAQRIRSTNEKLFENVIWGHEEKSESVTRMIKIIDDKQEVRVLLRDERELIGKIKSIERGLSGKVEMVLMDSTGHVFIIPYISITYIVKRETK